MSTTIDNKVVEMRFDNSQFESNVKTSMSTLERLKQSLQFKGAGKGLENVNNAVKNVDMTTLSNAVQTVQDRFSNLGIIGTTALVNITNQAVNAGKNIVSALTIDPIKTGFQEYETQINAVQTILANTEHKGTTLTQVNAALDELNTYADQTIYNFTEMTRNIGTFTAAGVDLDKSVTSIKGIANLAAVSGSNAQQASVAMYQLSQALAAGRVSLMDWNSVVNAGMGGQVFQNALKRTAEHLGHDVDALIEKYGSFRESLTRGEWLTAEVLTETLTQLSGAYTEADLIAQGYTEEQAKDIVSLAETAVNAATKVKTFTQLFDTLKESVQSGWTSTWEILIGDFEQAKGSLTELSEMLGEFVSAGAEGRNNFLKEAMFSNWDKMVGKLNEAGISSERFNTVLNKALDDAQIPVEDLIKEYGSLSEAFQAGAIDSKILQDAINGLVGETVDLNNIAKDFGFGTGFDGASEDVSKIQTILRDLGYDLGEYGEELDGVDGKFGPMTEAAVKAFQEVNGLEITGVIDDATLEKLKETQTTFGKLKTEVQGFIDNVDQLGGRQLLFDALQNILKAIMRPIEAIQQAFGEIFGSNPEGLYNFIAGFESFTEKLILGDDAFNNLKDTFKGLFSILDLFGTILGAVWDLIQPIFGGFGVAGEGILGFTGAIGRGITDLVEFIKQGQIVTQILQGIVKFIQPAIDWVAGLFSGFDLSFLTELGERWDAFKEKLALFFNTVSTDGFVWENFIALLGDFQYSILSFIGENFGNLLGDIGSNIIDGLVNGLKEGPAKVWEILTDIGSKILEAIKTVLGIHSPSTEMHEVGTNAVEGLINGFKDMFASLKETLGNFANGIIDFFKNVGLGPIIAGLIGVGLIAAIKKIIDIFDAFSSPFESFGDALEGLGASLKTKAIKNIAVSIGILAASLFALAQLEPEQLIRGGIAILGLAGVMAALIKIVDKTGDDFSSKKFTGLGVMMAGIGVAFFLMASSLKKLQDLDPDKMDTTLIGLGSIVGSMLLLMKGCEKLVNAKEAKAISKIGTLMIKLAIAMALMVGVIKLISKLKSDEVLAGAAAISAFLFVLNILGKITKKANDADKFAKLMIRFAVALGLMVIVIKLISTLTQDEIAKGAAAIAAFLIVINILAKITKKGQGVDKLGKTLIGMSVAMGVMALIARLLGTMETGDLAKGLIAVFILGKIVESLIKTLGKNKGQIGKIATTVLALSVAIGILAVVVALISQMSVEDLAVGLIVVAALGQIMEEMLKAARGAKKSIKTIVALVAAVAALAYIVYELSKIEPMRALSSAGSISLVLHVLTNMVEELAKIKPGRTGKINKDMFASLIGAIIAMVSVAGVMYLIQDVDFNMGTAASLAILINAMIPVVKACSMLGKGGAGTIKAAAIGATAFGAVVDIIIVLAGLVVGLVGALAQIDAVKDALITGAEMMKVIGGAIGDFFGAIVGSFVSTAMEGFGEGIEALGEALKAFGEATKELEYAEDSTTGTSAAIKLSKDLVLLAANVPPFGAFQKFLFGETDFQAFADGVKDLGWALSEFATAVKELEYVGDSTTGAGAAVKLCFGLVLLANFVPDGAAFEKFMFGETDFQAFSDGVIDLGGALDDFATAVEGLEYQDVSGAVQLAQGLARVANTVPDDDTYVEKATGLTKMASFSRDVAFSLAPALVSFKNQVEGLSYADVSGAVDLAQGLADVAKTIPDDDTYIEKAAGLTKMKTFSDGIKNHLAPSLNAFVTEVSKIDYVGKAPDLTVVVDLAQGLAYVAAALPPQSALSKIGAIPTDLDQFSEDLGRLGPALSTFVGIFTGSGGIEESAEAADKVDGSAIENLFNPLIGISDSAETPSFDYTEEMQKKVTAAVNLAKDLASLANSLPNESGINKLLGITDLDAFSEGVLNLANGLGEFADKFKDFGDEKGAEPGIENAKNLANWMKGFAESLPDQGFFDKLFHLTEIGNFGDGIGKLAEGLGKFASTFSDEDFTFDEDKLNQAKDLANWMKDFEAALPQGTDLQNFLGILGGTDLTNLAKGVGYLGAGLAAFAGFSDLVIGNVDQEKLDKATTLAGKLAILSNVIPKNTNFENIAGAVSGGSATDEGTFGKGIKWIGYGVAEFAKAIQDNEIPAVFDEAKADQAIKIATKLAAFVPTVPGFTLTDNILSWASGGEAGNMQTFSSGLGYLAEGLTEFATELSGMDSANVSDTNLNKAIKIASALASVQTSLNEEGGFADALNGTTAEAFAKLPGYATDLSNAINNFATNLGTIEDGDVVLKAAESLNAISSAMATIHNSLEMYGDNDLDDNINLFGEQAKSLAGKLLDFKEKLKECSIDQTTIDLITDSVNAIKTLSDTFVSMKDIDTSGIDNFTSSIESIAKADFSGLTAALEGVNTSIITTITDDLSGLVTSGDSIAESIADGITANTSASSSITIMLSNLITNIENRLGDFATAGKQLTYNLANGILSGASMVYSAAATLATNAGSMIRSGWTSFYNNGIYLGTGLINGIDYSRSAVYNAAYRLGQAAVQGEKDGQASKSPSKLTFQAGKWLGEGLINGMDTMGKAVYNSGYGMGRIATESMSKAISMVESIAMDDMAYEPKIRPVLDLNNIRSGAAYIDDMFNGMNTINATATASSLGLAFNRSIQNGKNDDLISAISDLRKDFHNLPHNTYNVNGITYDDGSNVASAVEQLVRASRIKRRV